MLFNFRAWCQENHRPSASRQFLPTSLENRTLWPAQHLQLFIRWLYPRRPKMQRHQIPVPQQCRWGKLRYGALVILVFIRPTVDILGRQPSLLAGRSCYLTLILIILGLQIYAMLQIPAQTAHSTARLTENVYRKTIAVTMYPTAPMMKLTVVSTEWWHKHVKYIKRKCSVICWPNPLSK